MSNAGVVMGGQIQIRAGTGISICDAMETMPSAAARKGIAALDRWNGSGVAQGYMRGRARSGSSVAQPVHGISVDGAAAVVALMAVPIVLISAAKLEQVVAFQHGKIVAQHLIVPVPETACGFAGCLTL